MRVRWGQRAEHSGTGFGSLQEMGGDSFLPLTSAPWRSEKWAVGRRKRAIRAQYAGSQVPSPGIQSCEDQSLVLISWAAFALGSRSGTKTGTGHLQGPWSCLEADGGQQRASWCPRTRGPSCVENRIWLASVSYIINCAGWVRPLAGKWINTC